MSALIKLCQTNSKTPNLLHVSHITRSVLRTSQILFGGTVQKGLESLKEKLRKKICISVSKLRRICFLALLKHLKNNSCIEVFGE